MEREKFEITINNYGNVFTANLPADAEIEDVMYAFYGLMIADTWCPETILRAMKNFVDERMPNKEEE